MITCTQETTNARLVLPRALNRSAAFAAPGDLASFANAYAVAIRLRESTRVDQFVVRTDDPLQPVRITRQRPANDRHMLVMVA